MDRTAIVLAGGLSTRFGQDKALVELGGKPLIKRVVDSVLKIVDEIVVVTSSEEHASKYEQVLGPHVKFAFDKDEAKGPLVGAISGFEAATQKYSLLLPSDTPFISVEVVKLLFELCPGKSAVIPRWPNSQIEPLHAVYFTRAALEAGRAEVKLGKLNVQSMIDAMRGVRYVSTLVIQELDVELKTFFNVNTPLDLRRAEAMYKPRMTSRK